MVNPVRGHVTYVFDAYCGWCHGFTPWLREALAGRPEVTVEVVSGGLFTGARRVPIRELTHIPTARHRVTQVTGAAFGPSFLKLLEQGGFVMDSQDAATTDSGAGPQRLHGLERTRMIHPPDVSHSPARSGRSSGS
ncbi:hypothetical protein QZH56_00940 [Streptomyces olivoreticuli]|uniref:hypothetical protein n=1 Tax=Streptomyces olivoreticuli TaxID=68246 RepID=UPI0026588DD9|nr:hypothetical protein [Streptomyces olivoreticuli]WKK24267.1 hypothetical protein QZH56_00940 [Streptomyces olivoreticuli]